MRDLVQQLERLVRANAQIDAGIKGDWKARMDEAAVVDRALDVLDTFVQAEMSRLTVEHLQDAHARRVRRDQKRKAEAKSK